LFRIETILTMKGLVIEQIAPIITRRLRQEVLYPGQPFDSVVLEEDDSGTHFGMYQEQALIAVVSLFLREQDAQFRKFAIDKAYQRQGYGSKLLRYITDYALHKGMHILWCHARITAVAFYQKNGFVKIGLPFMKGNISYVRMERNIKSK